MTSREASERRQVASVSDRVRLPTAFICFLIPRLTSGPRLSPPAHPHQLPLVAIKRINVTSSPERVYNELSILAEARGARHVTQLITAFRTKDQVVVVLPYHRNEDFRVRPRGTKR